MARKRRHRERWPQEAREARTASWDPVVPPDEYFLAQEREEEDTDDPSDYIVALGMSRMRQAVGKACGTCREFLFDENAGRGECLHPGSGILHPWTDTAACQFWRR